MGSLEFRVPTLRFVPLCPELLIGPIQRPVRLRLKRFWEGPGTVTSYKVSNVVPVSV